MARKSKASSDSKLEREILGEDLEAFSGLRSAVKTDRKLNKSECDGNEPSDQITQLQRALEVDIEVT